MKNPINLKEPPIDILSEITENTIKSYDEIGLTMINNNLLFLEDPLKSSNLLRKALKVVIMSALISTYNAGYKAGEKQSKIILN